MIKSAKFFKIQKPSKTPRNCLCAPDLSSAVAHDGRGTHRRGKAQRQGQRAIQQPCHQHHGRHQQQGANAAAKAWNSQKKKQQKTGINCVCV
jgi:hypothetical protein